MFIGTVISAIIGLIAGIVPAISASKLDPVEAIRAGM
jgi:putative ABC transport system permease protein